MGMSGLRHSHEKNCLTKGMNVIVEALHEDLIKIRLHFVECTNFRRAFIRAPPPPLIKCHPTPQAHILALL